MRYDEKGFASWTVLFLDEQKPFWRDVVGAGVYVLNESRVEGVGHVVNHHSRGPLEPNEGIHAAEGFTDGQRNSAQNLRDAIAKDRVLLSLGHNMAQSNGMTAAMIDVLTEYVHNSAIPAAEGQKRLVAAVAGAQ